MADEVSFAPPIDYNRGVTIKMHPDGFDVNMYKDAPGVFYDVNSNVLGSAIALEAGYDIKSLQTMREKRERIAEAQAAIEREYGRPANEVIASSGGFTAISIGNNLCVIRDEDGANLVDDPMSEEDATALVNKLAPTSEPEAKMEDFDTETNTPEEGAE